MSIAGVISWSVNRSGAMYAQEPILGTIRREAGVAHHFGDAEIY